MNDRLTLLTDEGGETDQPGPGWRFSVIPPRAVRARWYRAAGRARRPAGTLAVPAVATTAALHFTHVIHHDDTVMALGLTTLTVAYDAVIAICRTRLRLGELAHGARDRTSELRRAV